jgi:hypothetical protein
MQQLNLQDVSHYVEQYIGKFHDARLQGIKNLNLHDVLKRKNPYLFKAKNVGKADEIINGIISAHISSNEETIFGDWLEGLAIFINQKVYDGKKSGIQGIDLEFDLNGIRHIVAIKSGPSWGNSRQVKGMREDFILAAKTLRTSRAGIIVQAVNGCCYGKDDRPDKGDYMKYCGQRFWEFISGDSDLYTEIIIPLGHEAQLRNDEFKMEHDKIINRFIFEFMEEFCIKPEMAIDWNKLVKFNSAKKESLGEKVAKVIKPKKK